MGKRISDRLKKVFSVMVTACLCFSVSSVNILAENMLPEEGSSEMSSADAGMLTESSSVISEYIPAETPGVPAAESGAGETLPEATAPVSEAPSDGTYETQPEAPSGEAYETQPEVPSGEAYETQPEASSGEAYETQPETSFGEAEASAGETQSEAEESSEEEPEIRMDIPCLDENGKAYLIRDCLLLKSPKEEEEKTIGDGWYFVSDTTVFTEKLIVDGEVYLILLDKSVLSAQKGIVVNEGSTLTIYAQSTGDDKGQIQAVGTNRSAGIGGDQGLSGTITINGGSIAAIGGAYAAGIGSDYFDPSLRPEKKEDGEEEDEEDEEKDDEEEEIGKPDIIINAGTVAAVGGNTLVTNEKFAPAIGNISDDEDTEFTAGENMICRQGDSKEPGEVFYISDSHDLDDYGICKHGDYPQEEETTEEEITEEEPDEEKTTEEGTAEAETSGEGILEEGTSAAETSEKEILEEESKEEETSEAEITKEEVTEEIAETETFEEKITKEDITEAETSEKEISETETFEEERSTETSEERRSEEESEEENTEITEETSGEEITEEETSEEEMTEEETSEEEMTEEETSEEETTEEVEASHAELAGYSLTLNSRIGINFCMELEGEALPGVFASADDYYMEFTLNGKTVTVKLNEAVSDGNGMYAFTCPVAAIELGDTITAIYHYGAQQSAPVIYSVKEYLNYILQNSSDAGMIELAEKIINYGYYSSVYLSALRGWTYGVDHQAVGAPCGTPNTAADLGAYRYLLSDDSDTVDLDSMQLNMESQIDLYINFTIQDDIGNHTFTVNGNIVSPEVITDDSGTFCRIRIAEIPANELGNSWQVSADGKITVTVSALSPVQLALASDSVSVRCKNAMAALYEYYQAVVCCAGTLR